MDIDLLNSPTQDEHQMEIMMNMMMDNFPEFCGPYNEAAAADFPPTDSTGTNVGAIPHFIDNINTASFTNTQSSMSFSGSNPVEEPPAPPFSSRWRGEVPQGASNFASPSHKRNSLAAMREMIFRIAAMQPIHIDPESVKPPKRRNVKISKDPQSVAARHRRERISERIRILQRLVPGGTKMDTASMLDEAIHYVKFLKTQVQSLERAANRQTGIGFPVAVSNGSYMPMAKVYQPVAQNVQHYGDA